MLRLLTPFVCARLNVPLGHEPANVPRALLRRRRRYVQSVVIQRFNCRLPHVRQRRKLHRVTPNLGHALWWSLFLLGNYMVLVGDRAPN